MHPDKNLTKEMKRSWPLPSPAPLDSPSPDPTWTPPDPTRHHPRAQRPRQRAPSFTPTSPEILSQSRHKATTPSPPSASPWSLPTPTRKNGIQWFNPQLFVENNICSCIKVLANLMSSELKYVGFPANCFSKHKVLTGKTVKSSKTLEHQINITKQHLDKFQ